jgi:hypothetical protein
MENLIEATLQKSSAAIDDAILKWMFDAPIEANDRLQFFEGILGFCRSSLVENLLRTVTDDLARALKEFLESTWSSILSETDRIQRLAVCANVADAVGLPGVSLSILKSIFASGGDGTLRSIEMGQSLRNRGCNDQEIGLCAQSIIVGIISNVQESDRGWIVLATDQLCDDLPRYLRHGNDSVLLANLIQITNQILSASLEPDELSRDMAETSSCLLPYVSDFDIRNTLPELQQTFLALWDVIVQYHQQEPNNRVLEGNHDNLLTWSPRFLDSYAGIPQRPRFRVRRLRVVTWWPP